MSSTRLIQETLKSQGYDPGPLDGVRGRRTIAAIRRFQADKELIVDGIVGPSTRGRLFADTDTAPPTQDADRPWYEEARRLMGTAETPGPGSNAVILDWAEGQGIPYASDDIPWCGLLVAHCVGSTLPDEGLPGHPLVARAWLRFGNPCEPSKGCILIFWREKRAGFKGHVGFYAGEDETGFYVLGGNQSDAVNIKRLAKSQLLGARWPATAFYGQPHKVAMTLRTSGFETALS